MSRTLADVERLARALARGRRINVRIVTGEFRPDATPLLVAELTAVASIALPFPWADMPNTDLAEVLKVSLTAVEGQLRAMIRAEADR